MKLLIRFFWMVSLASMLLFLCLHTLRAMDAIPLDAVECCWPIVLPLCVGCLICVSLGLIDLVNATAEWARWCDRDMRRASRAPRYVRRRRR